jgi:hypothetical protein
MEFPNSWDKIVVSIKKGESGARRTGTNLPKKRRRESGEEKCDGKGHANALHAEGFQIMENMGQSSKVNSNAEVLRVQDISLKRDYVHNHILENIESAEMEHTEHIARFVQNITTNLQDIISATNYREILGKVSASDVEFTQEIKVVSKAYEDTFLRQAIHATEKPCVREECCECMFIDPCQPFVGVRYILPWETTDAQKQNACFCLPCLRAMTLAMYVDIVHSGRETNAVIQRFTNEHSKPGEYKLSAMLICAPNGPVHNLPLPIVRHQRTCYHVYQKNGVHYAKQINVDFQ